MQRLSRLLIVLLALSFVIIAQANEQAQDVEQPTCTPEEYAAIADEVIAAAEELKTAEDQALQITIIQVLLSTRRSQCGGLTFTSEEYGQNAVIGPVLFNDGFYRVTFTSDTFGSSSVEGMEGDCDILTTLLVSSMDGGADAGAFEFAGCVGLIEVNTTGVWTLVFEPVR
jgi:hypothetical protein